MFIDRQQQHECDLICGTNGHPLLYKFQRVEVGVQEVQVEYGVYVKLDGHHQIKEDDFPSVEEEQPSAPDTIVEEESDNAIPLFRSNVVYPSFHTYSTIGYMIFCTTFVVTMFDVARQLRNSRKLKKYAAVPTESD